MPRIIKGKALKNSIKVSHLNSFHSPSHFTLKLKPQKLVLASSGSGESLLQSSISQLSLLIRLTQNIFLCIGTPSTSVLSPALKRIRYFDFVQKFFKFRIRKDASISLLCRAFRLHCRNEEVTPGQFATTKTLAPPNS